MELKEKGNLWLYFYRVGVSNPHALPNLCPLFWGGIYGFLLMLFTPVATIVNLILANRKGESLHRYYYHGIGAAAWFLIEKVLFVVYMASVVVVGDIFWDEETVPLWIWLIGWLAPILGLALVIAITTGVIYLFTEESPLNKNASIIKEFAKAKAGKYCPKINWK